MNRESAQFANRAKVIMSPSIARSIRRLMIENWSCKATTRLQPPCMSFQMALIHLARFNREGISYLGIRKGAGSKPLCWLIVASNCHIRPYIQLHL